MLASGIATLILSVSLLKPAAATRYLSSPYIMPSLGVERFVPFTDEELALVKKLQVRRITKSSGNELAEYYFSKNGLLDSSVNRRKLKNKWERHWRIAYLYNPQGQPLRLVCGINALIHIDTLGYENGQLVYYKGISNSGRKKEVRNFHATIEVQLKEKNEQGYVLMRMKEPLSGTLHPTPGAKEDEDFEHYHYTTQNEFIRYRSYHRSDSVVITPSDSGYTKTYYLKKFPETTYRILQKEVYVNKRLISSQCFPEQGFSNQDLSHVYDSQNRLTLVRDNLRQHMYQCFIYDENGLKISTVRVYGGYKHQTDVFFYLFYP